MNTTVKSVQALYTQIVTRCTKSEEKTIDQVRLGLQQKSKLELLARLPAARLKLLDGLNPENRALHHQLSVNLVDETSSGESFLFYSINSLDAPEDLIQFQEERHRFFVADGT